MITVSVPRDAGLARLLRSHAARVIGADRGLASLANAADPDTAAAAHVTFATGQPGAGLKLPGGAAAAETAAEALTALLREARAAGDPAAEALVPLLAQLGVTPPPAPEPRQPAGAPRPAS